VSLHHLLVTGQTRSGKTVLTRRLVRLAPRVVALDPQGDYVGEGDVYTDFRSSSLAWLRAYDCERYRIVYSPPEGGGAGPAFRAWLRLLYRVQSERGGPPVVVIMEEASIYSDAGSVPEELDWAIRAGLKSGLVVVSVVQTDVDIGKSIRRNAALQVYLRQLAPSTDTRRTLRRSDLSRLPDLETLTPDQEPREGVHYVTYPPGLDILGEWESMFRK